VNVLAPKVRLDPPPERDARADTDLVRVQVEVPAVSEAFLELVADADLPLPVGEVPDLGEPDRVGVAVARRKLPVESLLFEIVPCMAVKEVCRSVLRETDLAARGEDVRPAEEVSVQDPPVQPTNTPTAIPVPQCSDGIDNDQDGAIDMRDKGCTSPNDNGEAN